MIALPMTPWVLRRNKRRRIESRSPTDPQHSRWVGLFVFLVQTVVVIASVLLFNMLMAVELEINLHGGPVASAGTF